MAFTMPETPEKRKGWLERKTGFITWLKKEINSWFTMNYITKDERDGWEHDLEHVQDCVYLAEVDVQWYEYIEATLNQVAKEILSKERVLKMGKHGRHRHHNHGKQSNITIIDKRRREPEVVETKQVGYSTQVTKLETPEFRKPETEKETIIVKKDTPILKLPDMEVHIAEEVFRKIMTWTKLLDVEVTGLGTVSEITPGKFFVDSIFLFEQVVTGGSCVMKSPQAFVELCQRIEASGKDVAKLKFWWHSHNKLGAFFSSQDETTGAQYKSSDWMISLVTNHRDEMSCKINYYKPIEMVITNVPVMIDQAPIEEEYLNARRAELDQFVKKETTTYYVNSQHQDYSAYQPPAEAGAASAVPTVEDARRALDLIQSGAQDMFSHGAPSVRDKNSDDGPIHPHPMGEYFEENGFIYEWDFQNEYYRYFKANPDGSKGREYNEIEIEEMGGDNYNKNLVYKVQAPVSQEGG